MNREELIARADNLREVLKKHKIEGILVWSKEEDENIQVKFTEKSTEARKEYHIMDKEGGNEVLLLVAVGTLGMLSPKYISIVEKELNTYINNLK